MGGGRRATAGKGRQRVLTARVWTTNPNQHAVSRETARAASRGQLHKAETEREEHPCRRRLQKAHDEADRDRERHQNQEARLIRRNPPRRGGVGRAVP